VLTFGNTTYGWTRAGSTVTVYNADAGEDFSVLYSFSAASATTVYEEEVSASGTSFTLAHTPIVGTLRLYRGGARQQRGAGKDYTMSGATGTLAAAAAVGEVFLADYNY
jgi:hypothetical protein